MTHDGVEAVLVWLRSCIESGGEDLAVMRATYDAMADDPPATVTVDDVELGGVPCEAVRPASPERVLLYFHGGGYAIGSPASHRGLAGRLADAAAARVIVADYRRAPEHPFPAAVVDAGAVWSALVADGVDPARIVVAGDSCGGALALVLAMAARDAGRPVAAVATLSAWTDLTGPTAPADDPVLAPATLSRLADQYLAGARARDWRASPRHGDLAGLPPLLMQVGEREVLRADNRRFVDLVRAAGGEVEYEEYPEMIHVFQMYASRLPEAAAAIERIGAFARRHVPTTPSGVVRGPVA